MLCASMGKHPDIFRWRSTRFMVAYLVGLNATGLIFALSLAVGSAIHHMNVAAFLGAVIGIAVGVAAGLSIARAIKQVR